MITTKNYFDHIGRISFEKLPEEIKKAHLVIMTKTDTGKDWDIYDKEKEMKNMIDLVFQKLGEFIAAKGKTLNGVSSDNKARFTEELKIIRRFLNLHGKRKTKDEILAFIDALQRPLLAKKIRKSSFFSREIMFIQEKMVALYNRMHSWQEIKLRDETIARMNIAIQLIEKKNRGKTTKEEMKNKPLSVISRDNQRMCSTDFADMKFDSIGFDGKWLQLIGDPCKGFTAMIYGKPKMGKSYLAIDFAGYLARNHGRVLYVAKEEKLDATLQKKLNDKNVAHVNLFVSDHLPDDLSTYDFIFLDSVNKLALTSKDLEQLKTKNPGKCFIYVFQTTKLGAFRGKNEFQHDVDVVIEIPEKGKAVQFGRFNQGGEVSIFENDISETEIQDKPPVESVPLADAEELNGIKDAKKKDPKKAEAVKMDLTKFDNRSDDLNPRYLFQLTATQLLVEALKADIDLDYLVRLELANRGVDQEGNWVGFDKSKIIHNIK